MTEKKQQSQRYPRFLDAKIEIPTLLCVLVLLMLGGGCQSTYDYDSFGLLYTGIYSSSYMEPLYVLLQDSCRSLGIDYELFRLLIYGFSIVIIAYTSYRIIGKKTPLLLLLYFIFPFAYSFNLRSTLASAFVLIGFYLYLSSNRFGIAKLGVSIVLATLVQSSALAYILLLIAAARTKLVSRSGYSRNDIIAFFIIIIVVFALCVPGLLQAVADRVWIVISSVTFASDRKKAFFEVSGRYGFLGYAACHISFTITIAYIRYVINKDSSINEGYRNSLDNRLIECINILNILLILLIPMIRVNGELYRIFRGITVLEYLAFFSGYKYLAKDKQSSAISIALLLLSVTINFVFMIIPIGDSVFITMFTENRFFP